MSKKASAKGGAVSTAAAAKGRSDFHASFSGSKRPSREQVIGALDRIFRESGCIACGLIGKIWLDLADPIERLDIPNVNIFQQKFGG